MNSLPMHSISTLCEGKFPVLDNTDVGYRESSHGSKSTNLLPVTCEHDVLKSMAGQVLCSWADSGRIDDFWKPRRVDFCQTTYHPSLPFYTLHQNKGLTFGLILLSCKDKWWLVLSIHCPSNCEFTLWSIIKYFFLKERSHMLGSVR